MNKPVTLKGSGNSTVIYPATSNPACGGGSLCGGAASNIVLVQANNVTITKLRLEGDNPALTSGVVVGGKDIDARNGIITNHEAGTYNNLTVSKVKVSDVYLRGMYASSGGTFDFNHDTVENVQAEEASIAMFAFGGSGTMSHNKVDQRQRCDLGKPLDGHAVPGQHDHANRAAACTPTTTATPAGART